MRIREETARASRPAGPRDWLEDEPRIASVGGEFLRLCQRACKRPLAMASVTAIVALLVAAQLKFDPRGFDPRLVLRVTETDRVSAADARSKQQLRDYVSHVAFSDANLLSIIDRFGLYPLKKPRDALRAFRQDIQVDVYRNYFLSGLEGAGPRSARIAIAYRSLDPQLAVTVNHALGKLVETQEADSRRRQSSLAALQADRALARLSARMLRQRRAIAEKGVALLRGDAAPAQLRVEMADLAASVARAEPRLLEIARRKAELDLDAARDQGQTALRFDIVDSGAVPRSQLPSASKLWLRGALELLLGLPLVGLLVGAFDPRLRDSDDVRDLGLMTLGRVRLSRRQREGTP